MALRVSFFLKRNPHGRPNSDVLRPICNAFDITRRYRFAWNVDFGLDMPLDEAAKYEAPFEHIKKVVYPQRQLSIGRHARSGIGGCSHGHAPICAMG